MSKHKNDDFFALNFKLLETNSKQPKQSKQNTETSKKAKDIFFYSETESQIHKDEKSQIKKLSNLCDSYLLTDYKDDNKDNNYKLRNEKDNNDSSSGLIAPENRLSLYVKRLRNNSKKEVTNNSILNSRIITNFNESKDVASTKKKLNILNFTSEKIDIFDRSGTPGLEKIRNFETETTNNNLHNKYNHQHKKSFLYDKNSFNPTSDLIKDKLNEFKKSIENGFENSK